MTVYISGPITDVPDYKEKFGLIEASLKLEGYETVNPSNVNLGENATWEEYMRHDIKLLCDCDAVFMMKGWQRSKGARVENYIAKKLGLLVINER